MRRALLAGFCGSAILIGGCNTAAKPARLSKAPTAEQRAELAQVIEKMTGSKAWTYDADAFFTDGSITARPADGMVNDRSMGKPMRFYLMKSGSDCMIASDAHSKSALLSTITCEAVTESN